MSLAEFTTPPLRPTARIRAAVRAAIRILRTGQLPNVQAYAAGVSHGMDLGESIILGEFNARLVAQGIAPIRGV